MPDSVFMYIPVSEVTRPLPPSLMSRLMPQQTASTPLSKRLSAAAQRRQASLESRSQNAYLASTVRCTIVHTNQSIERQRLVRQSRARLEMARSRRECYLHTRRQQALMSTVQHSHSSAITVTQL
ncbi:hypothetical protein KIPB_007436 [Kipferlia bialata]|uniref:Uncharacterized protein n=1 Tax=Kipferlia bialata TaxID=797122 RepID=A0A9K3D170_9EUKA|nr:hypothetical protein KIPB_007436 [Kipferlia bialata]|eukprot:g7436.t1